MKQLGNLAMVCAQRPEVLMQLHAGAVTVYVGEGPERAALSAPGDVEAPHKKNVDVLKLGKKYVKMSA